MRMFVPRDIDGFFGLFVDNLVQLLLIVSLCGALCGMSGENAHYLFERILPGAAVSIIVGNVFYAWQAHRLAKREGRDDVTALPYGINTPSLLVYVFFVMQPAASGAGGSAEKAWKLGMLACFGSGVIEFLGSFVAEWVRRKTPRAALLSTLAGIAIGFIAMTFALQIWTKPLIAMVPMAIVLVTYFSGIRFPWHLPGGLIAMLAGTGIALICLAASGNLASLGWKPELILPPGWTTLSAKTEAVQTAWQSIKYCPPIWFGNELLSVLQDDPKQWVGLLSVIIPMGLFNVIGSLQNIESAEAAGDRFSTTSSLAVNGIGTILASFFGSCFPTTIYIGHPGWKQLGARAGYSTLNGIVITIVCLTGAVALVNSIVPMEAGIAIVLWIGVVITAQAFQATPSKHAPAVAIGLFPAIAAWGAAVMFGAFMMSGGNAQSLLEKDPNVTVSGFLLHGLLVMDRGYIFTCMITSALSACLIDQKFGVAAAWSALAAVATVLGLMHAYQLTGNVVDYLLIGVPPNSGALAYRAYDIAVGYALMAVTFAAIRWHDAKHGSEERIAHA